MSWKKQTPKQKMTDTSMNATCQEVLQEHRLTRANVRLTVCHHKAYLRQEKDNSERERERERCEGKREIGEL